MNLVRASNYEENKEAIEKRLEESDKKSVFRNRRVSSDRLPGKCRNGTHPGLPDGRNDRGADCRYGGTHDARCR